MSDVKTSNKIQDSAQLLDYLEVLVINKRMIICLTVVAFFTSIIISLLLPKIYSSTALISPPQQENSIMGMMVGQLSAGTGGLASDLLGGGSTSDRYARILKSESIKDPIIDRYNLIKEYETKYRVDTYKELDKHTSIEAGKMDGLISITVEDENPSRAADIANAFVEELSKLMVNLSMTGAKNSKPYLEDRLTKTKADLKSAEDNLKSFQIKNKALDISEQSKGSIKGIADLEAMLVAEELKLASLKRLYTESSLEVRNQLGTVTSLRSQINKFEGVKAAGAVPGLGSVPEIAQQYLRLMREFKKQESLLDILTKQYELTKLNETRDTPVIQIIQKARVADKKIRPKRATIVLTVTFAAFFMSVIISFFKVYTARMSEVEIKRWKQILTCFNKKNQ